MLSPPRMSALLVRRNARLALRSRRGLASAAETATDAAAVEESSTFTKVVAGLVGLCVVQRLIPEPKKEQPTVKHKRAKPKVVEAVVSVAPEVEAVVVTAVEPAAESALSSTEDQLANLEQKLGLGAPTASPQTIAQASVAHEAILREGGKRVLGSAGAWSVYSEDGAVFASSAITADQPPIQLTPAGLTAGAVLLGSDELLVALDGYGTDAECLYRIRLPMPDPEGGPPNAEAIELVPDTLTPAGVATPPGSVLGWITDGSPIAVRGALVQCDECIALVLRDCDSPRIGSPLWVQTCKRLGLPPPPIDPSGPMILGDWRVVATWERPAASAIGLIGFRDEVAWVHDAATRTVVGVSTIGERLEVPL